MAMLSFLQNLSDADAVKDALLCTNQIAEEAQIAETVNIDAAIK